MNGFDPPWWVFWLIVALFVVGVWALFRSLRRWQQPPAGHDADAQAAERELQMMSRRNSVGRG